ncbi:hypothetical protein ACFP2F_00115 [Hymenobacter artigasi]|uniref:Lipocalin-like domain-containing protein n=1 Tax=Hymenobacter artigasi TaxID=2719616 RepID=A0ABX1HF89_9BACT|nr:hypothetical protein [Hymenobacter artigasi]NKI87443.1 hypothetical protein [Hymenobacter artigasi]
MLMLLVGLTDSNSIQGQRIARPQLVGHWLAIDPAEEDTFINKDGQPLRFKGRPAITITLDFKSDNHASLTIKDAESSKIRPFTYRIINSNLIERRYSQGEKPVRETLTITKNKLWLAPYPMPKPPQESIDLLYSLTFVKQP